MMLAIETIKVTETVGRLVFLIYSVSIFYSVALAHTLSKLERLDCNNGWAYMARKTERVNDNDNQDRNKKVKFDKNATIYIYIYDKENEKEKKITDKI